MSRINPQTLSTTEVCTVFLQVSVEGKTRKRRNIKDTRLMRKEGSSRERGGRAERSYEGDGKLRAPLPVGSRGRGCGRGDTSEPHPGVPVCVTDLLGHFTAP